MAVPRSPILPSGAARPIIDDDAEEDIHDGDLDDGIRTPQGPENPLAQVLQALEEARAEIRNQRAIIAGLQRASTQTPAAELRREP